MGGECMDQRAVQEAVQAWEAALASIQRAREKLESAKNWGIFDIFGGGMISSMVKHSRMDDASGYMEEAKRKLTAFERELKDISISAELSVEMGNFLRFMDTFMDNIFVDFVVQSRINEAIAGLDDVSGRVRGILAELYPLLQD